jgi:hypothetical protein
VLASGIVLAGGVACMGKPVVGAALLIAVPRLAGQRQRGVMAGECLAGLAGGQVRFPASVERRGLSARIADPKSASRPGFTCTLAGGKDIRSYGFQQLPWPPAKSRRFPLASACGTPQHIPPP